MKAMMEELARCPLFASIPEERMEAVLGELGAQKMRMVRGEAVRLPQTRPIAVVLTGRIHVLQGDYWGQCSILHVLHPGKMVGESFTQFSGMDLGQEAVADTDSTLLALRRDRLLTGDLPERVTLLENLLGIYAVHQRVFLQKFQILSRRKTRDRLLAYLSQQAMEQGSACFAIPFTRQALADYLCVERSAMCTELSNLQREGVLTCSGKRFELQKLAQESADQ